LIHAETLHLLRISPARLATRAEVTLFAFDMFVAPFGSHNDCHPDISRTCGVRGSRKPDGELLGVLLAPSRPLHWRPSARFTETDRVVAGPNGAGKTTFAREFLPQEADCPTFVNADLIADGLSPFDPARVAIRSARIMLQLIREHAERGETFAFETTLAGRNYARPIRRWQAAGYRVTLIFLSLPSTEMALSRVAERVLQGGHGVPEDVVRRRFIAGRENFETLYKPLVDEWLHYDNSGTEPMLLERGVKS
jgi:predicted ABC-type ATPase